MLFNNNNKITKCNTEQFCGTGTLMYLHYVHHMII